MSKESEGIKERQMDRLTFDSDREGGNGIQVNNAIKQNSAPT